MERRSDLIRQWQYLAKQRSKRDTEYDKTADLHDMALLAAYSGNRDMEELRDVPTYRRWMARAWDGTCPKRDEAFPVEACWSKGKPWRFDKAMQSLATVTGGPMYDMSRADALEKGLEARFSGPDYVPANER